MSAVDVSKNTELTVQIQDSYVVTSDKRSNTHNEPFQYAQEILVLLIQSNQQTKINYCVTVAQNLCLNDTLGICELVLDNDTLFFNKHILIYRCVEDIICFHKKKKKAAFL